MALRTLNVLLRTYVDNNEFIRSDLSCVLS